MSDRGEKGFFHLKKRPTSATLFPRNPMQNFKRKAHVFKKGGKLSETHTLFKASKFLNQSSNRHLLISREKEKSTNPESDGAFRKLSLFPAFSHVSNRGRAREKTRKEGFIANSCQLRTLLSSLIDLGGTQKPFFSPPPPI